MKIKITSHIDVSKILQERGLGGSDAARKALASEVVRLCDPYVPMQQGTLKNDVQIAPDGSQIIYPGPYAHYQYYGEVMAGRAPKHYTGKPLDYNGKPLRGKHWDKRMMADHAHELAQALAKEVGGTAK